MPAKPARNLAILILAAGSSSRMRGADKLVLTVEGVPLLARVAGVALATGLPVWVALPTDRPARGALLEGLPVNRVTVADAQEGLAATLRAGIGAMPQDIGAVMVVLGDMPGLTAADLGQLAAAHAMATDDPILRATTADGIAGNPVILPRWLFDEVAELSGDRGAQVLLRRHANRVREIALPGQHARIDLDTPEDWAAYRP